MKHRSSNSIRSVYDELYQQADYYGKALPMVLEYLQELPKGSDLLDVGCGQGRYAIPLAEMGFNVTAIDTSAKAIYQLVQKIILSNLNINTFLSDAYLFTNYLSFDVLFFNLFFHFNRHELTRQKNLLKRITREQKVGSKLIIVGYNDEWDIKLIQSIFSVSPDHEIQRKVRLGSTKNSSPTPAFQYFLMSIEKKY